MGGSINYQEPSTVPGEAHGANATNLNDSIGELVKAGMAPRIQHALDVVRVVGNNAVHPGQIDVDDNPQRAAALFELVNLIAEATITQPNKIDTLYQRLPDGPRHAIERRDQP